MQGFVVQLIREQCVKNLVPNKITEKDVPFGIIKSRTVIKISLTSKALIMPSMFV